jgi:hypothetical protein
LRFAKSVAATTRRAPAFSMDAIKHAAETLPFGGFKESEVAAFLAPGWN